jgi:hypothetical protein
VNDLAKFYNDWLNVSRCKIRDFERCEGRMIGEPVRASSAGKAKR